MNERICAVFLVLIVTFGCNSASSQQIEDVVLDDPIVMVWRSSHAFGGTEIFEVQSDGFVHYTFEPGFNETPAPIDATVRLSETQLEELRQTLSDHDFCDIESEREMGIPDEGRANVAVDWGEVNCSVSMWDGEWRENSDAAAVAAAIRTLIQAARANNEGENESENPQ